MTDHEAPRTFDESVPAPATSGDGGATTAHPGSGLPSASSRLLALDAARGLALAGMIIVNVGPIEVDSLAQRLYLFPYGRASVLFVVVAGIGMGFFLRSRAQAARRWPTIAWRAGVLLLGGLGLQVVTSDVGVILPVYGILFGTVLVTQRLPRAALLAIAVTLTIAGPVVFLTHGASEYNAHLTPVRLGDSPGELIHGLVLSGRYPVVTWIVPFLIGLWAAKLNLRSRVVTSRLMLWGATSAVAGLAASQATRSLLGSDADRGYMRLLTGAAHGQMPLWLVSSVGGALFTVAVLLRLWPIIGSVASPLVAAGQLALTLYVLHVLALAMVDPPDDLPFSGGVTISASMIVTSLVLATVWRRFRVIGPLEWVLRASWLPGQSAHRRTSPLLASAPSPSGSAKESRA